MGVFSFSTALLQLDHKSGRRIKRQCSSFSSAVDARICHGRNENVVVEYCQSSSHHSDPVRVEFFTFGQAARFGPDPLVAATYR